MITTSIDYNRWLNHLDTQLNEPTNNSSMKVSISLHDKPTNKKTNHKTLETSVINIPMTPPNTQ